MPRVKQHTACETSRGDAKSQNCTLVRVFADLGSRGNDHLYPTNFQQEREQSLDAKNPRKQQEWRLLAQVYQSKTASTRSKTFFTRHCIGHFNSKSQNQSDIKQGILRTYLTPSDGSKAKATKPPNCAAASSANVPRPWRCLFSDAEP